jgi:molecular chaperone GrpE
MPDQTLDEQDSRNSTQADRNAAVGTQTDPIEAIRGERDALQDRLLRTAAEFENYRKRIDRERREQSDSAAAHVLADLLPIVDDLERALSAPDVGDADAYRKGVELILHQMHELLRRRGVTPIAAAGADFDPRVHQAVVQEPSEEHREGEVMEELRRGYMLGDRLLRPAMVKVATRE